MSNQQLCISVRFIQPFPLFHGRGDADMPEWPPSPMRVFEAILNAASLAARGRPLAPEIRNALYSLEVLRPQIVAPRAAISSVGYRAYVPHNQTDLVTAAWHRGNLDASIASHRMEKDFRPMRIESVANDLPAIHYCYPLDTTTLDPDGLLRALRPSVRAITHLGWGIDQAVADATLVDRDAQPLSGERWLPCVQTGRRLRVHRNGSLDALIKRHGHFLNRLKDGWTPVPPFTDDDVDLVRYRRDTDPLPRPQVVFKLVDENEDTFRYPHAKLIHIAGMVRHLAIDRMTEDPPPWIENPAEWVNRVVRGKWNKEAGDDHQQFSYVPLPSIGHAQADAMIRNVMIVAPEGMERELDHLADRLDGLELKPESDPEKCKAPNIADQIWLQRFRPPPRKFIAECYIGTADVWETVTPAILDGHRKAKFDDAKAVARTTERLIRKALARAGIEAPCEFTWQMVPFIKNGLSAHERDKERRLTGYFRPEYLQGRSAVHVRLSFGRRAVEEDTEGRWTPIEVSGPLTMAPAGIVDLVCWQLPLPTHGDDQNMKTQAERPAASHGKSRPIPTLARFLLSAPVLPLITDTVPVAEAFRNAIMSQFNRWCIRHPDQAEPFRRPDKPDLFSSRTLSGKELDGTIRKDHRHAFYLPTADSDDARWISHLTVSAAEGFGPGEIGAFNAVRCLRLGDESAELRVQLIGLGSQQDFRAPLLTESAIWISTTPYLATRYLKRRGQKKDPTELRTASPQEFAKHNLHQELQRRPDLPPVLSVDFLDDNRIGNHRLLPIQFKRARHKFGDDGSRRAAGAFRIVFARPIAGPLCLGHSCHFGMGLFVPEE